jgi:hypothetical protein
MPIKTRAVQIWEFCAHELVGGSLVCFLGVRQTRAVPHMTLTCECVAGTHHGRGDDDREYARARDSPKKAPATVGTAAVRSALTTIKAETVSRLADS